MAAAFILAGLLSSGHAVAATFSQTAASPEPSAELSGYFSTRFMFRTAETSSTKIDRDQDVFGDLRIDVTAPTSNRYEFHFMGSFRTDLDGNRDLHQNYLLEDTGDTGAHSTTGYLYEAHFDVNHPITGVTQVRMGRQPGTRDEQVTFDGIAMDLRPFSSVNLTLYGGAAVNLYEIGRSESDDTVAGAGLDLSPTASTGISLDYAALKDKRDELAMTDVKDDLVSIRVWQRFTPSLKGTVRYRYQNDEARDLTVRILGSFPGAGTEFGASYLRQFRTQAEQSNALSPFVDVMGHSDPYHSIEAKLRQFFGKRYALNLAYFKRELIGDSLPGTFNREYTRSAAGFEVSDLFLDNLSLTLSGDLWRSPGSPAAAERTSASSGADIGYSFGKKGSITRINAGTYYSLYKYDYYLQLGERTNVRTYYLTAAIPVVKQVALSLGYEYEHSIETYQTLKAGIRYDF
ncbi:MAG: hypothetical protein ACYC7L_05280 [Nitrospirota bacterium]